METVHFWPPAGGSTRCEQARHPRSEAVLGLGELITLRWQEIGEQHQAGDEHTGHDDINNVEEWLPTNDERVDDFNASRVVRRAALLAADHPRAVIDGPFAVFCRAEDIVRWGARSVPRLHTSVQSRQASVGAGVLDCLGPGLSG